FYKVGAVERFDLKIIYENISGVRLEQAHEEFESDAFPGAAPAQDAADSALWHVEGNIVQHLFFAEALRHTVESYCRHRSRHSAPAGNRMNMIRTSKTLMKIRSIDESTTLIVEARPIPLDPPVAVYPRYDETVPMMNPNTTVFTVGMMYSRKPRVSKA